MRPLRPRGFTLLELMISTGATAIVLGFVVMSVNAQQRAFTAGNKQRGAQMNGRAAMLFIEEELALAGYGMDAPLAFDFDRYQGPCPAELAPCPRDSKANSDEIVFFHREPQYWVPDDYTAEPSGNAWRISASGVSETAAHASVRNGDVFHKGEILQAVCKSASAYAYFTVSDNVTIAANDPDHAIPLLPSVASDPFRRQSAATDACFKAGQARLFRIDRVRFHVRPVNVGGKYDPYLVLDRGIDVNGDGNIDENDEVLLAEGIELVQFAYVMTSASLVPRGSIPGTAVTLTAGFPGATSGDGLTTLSFPGLVPAGSTVYQPTSFYGYAVGPPPHANRNTDHQANIRAVRVAVRARSEFPDPQFVGGDQLTPLFNLDTLPAWITTDESFGRYKRANFISSVSIRNMINRGMTDF